MKVFLLNIVKLRHTVRGKVRYQFLEGGVPALLVNDGDRFSVLSDDEDMNELVKGATASFVQLLRDSGRLWDRTATVAELTAASVKL